MDNYEWSGRYSYMFGGQYMLSLNLESNVDLNLYPVNFPGICCKPPEFDIVKLSWNSDFEFTVALDKINSWNNSFVIHSRMFVSFYHK